MKKSYLSVVMLSAFALAACGEKDKAYYVANPDKAEAKFQECRKAEEAAFLGNDKEKLKEFRNEKSECYQVRQARAELREIQAEKERAEKEAQKQAEIAKFKADLESQYANQSWQDFTRMVAGSDCVNLLDFNRDAKCQAMKAIYEEKTAPVIKELRAKGLDGLLAERGDYCKQDQRKFSACSVWETAAKEQADEDLNKLSFEELLTQSKDKFCAKDDYMGIHEPCRAFKKVVSDKEKAFVKNLADNYDNLKNTYNACVDKVAAAKGWQAKAKISGAFPCEQARDARSVLRLPFDDFQTKMD